MSFELPFEKIQSAIQEHLNMEADPVVRTIKLEFKGSIYEDIPFGDMLEDEEGLKRMAKNFMDEDIEYTANPLTEGKGVMLQFKTDEDYQKMYDFLTGIIYGDLLKELMEKIMKSMFDAFDSNRSQFDNST
ncbi:MAG: hypothetical protein ACFFD8_08985 [Candidatus Thorarchaeota archaeon]